MASLAKSVSGNVTTYTITDMEGGILSVAVNANPVTGNGCTFTSTGALRTDGLDMLAQLSLQWATQLVP